MNYWTRENPNFSQLFTVLMNAEELGFAEKNTIIGILQEERQQATHCTCKYLRSTVQFVKR